MALGSHCFSDNFEIFFICLETIGNINPGFGGNVGFPGFGGNVGFGVKLYTDQVKLNNEDYDSVEKEPTKPMVNRPADTKKPSKHQNEDEKYSSSKPSYGNQLPFYQYPNGVAPFTTLIGAAISPAIIPVSNFYPDLGSYVETSNSNKTSKKKQSNKRQKVSSSKKAPKESNRQSNYVPYSTSSYYSPDNNIIPMKNDKPSTPVYLNFLNTYSPDQNYQNVPNFNGVNSYDNQFNQPNGQFNQFNPFNSPFSGIQNSYGNKPNQNQGNNSPSYNKPSNGQNSFTNSPFSGSYINPSFNGNLPAKLIANAKPSTSYSTPKPNDKSEETEEEVRINRQPRT